MTPTIRLIFTKSDDVGGKLIRAADGGKANHVGIWVPHKNMVLDSTFGHGGVRYHDMAAFLHRRRVVNDVTFSVPREPDWDWADAQVGKKYDTFALAGRLVWRRDWQEEDKWFCSELAIALAVRAGKQLAEDFDFIGVRMSHELAYAWSQA